MALFSRTTKKKEAAADAEAVTYGGLPQSLAHVLQSPRITEKASMAMEGFVYVFDVAPKATKSQISQAVQAVYKVTPRKVRVVVIPVKITRNMRTGQSGSKGGGKKAYVYLNKGETITIA